MTAPTHYTAAHARRSLGYFVLGKLGSAVAGVVWLLWLVRLAPPAEYGIYVAVVAVLEIFYLASGFGLSTMAQRYVAEYRVKAPAAQFGRFVWSLLVRRLLLAVAAALGLWLVLQPLLAWWGLSLEPGLGPWFLALLVVGCASRYLDEILAALLMQGVSQGVSMLGNLLRLATAAWFWQTGIGLGHGPLVKLELAVCAVATAVSALALWRHLARQPGPAGGPAHHNPQMARVALHFYVVQLLGQAWSGNAARLAVARSLGAAQVGAFGFAWALVDMLRNYLPAYLLATWVRPLMVARYLRDGNLGAVHELANLVLKLSLMVLLPLAAAFAAQGDTLAHWLSGGRFGPGMGLLLTWLTVLAGLQCAHVVVGMVSATVERTQANLLATALCCAALPLGALGVPAWGAVAYVAALCGAEVVWITMVMVGLSRGGVGLHLHWPGLLRIAMAGLPAALLMQVWQPGPGPWVLPAILACALVVLAALWWLKPLTPTERALLVQALPLRLRARLAMDTSGPRDAAP